MSDDRPLILVSNDDGFFATGLKRLASDLTQIGRVVVVAPERPRSGVSRLITLHKPLRVRRVSAEYDFYSCSGSPTDCVYIALNHLLDRKPDIVVSGVNHGANLGDDVFYSGTAAAAFEGVAHGIPAIAASLAAHTTRDWSGVTGLTRRVASWVLDKGLPARTILNINAPDGFTEEDEVRITMPGRRGYERLVTRRQDPRGGEYFWIGGSELKLDDRDGTDCHAILEGAASVTPVTLDVGNRQLADTIDPSEF